MPHHLNPAWCATTSLTTSHPAGVLVGDAAMLLTVLGAFSDRAPGRTVELKPFEDNLVALSEGRVVQPFDIELRLADLRRDLRMRNLEQVVEVARRMVDVRNGGRRVVSHVTVEDDVATFRIATGPGATQAHPFFARRVTKLPSRRGDAPFADRSHTVVDPLALLEFRSLASVHAYLRLRTWLTSPSRVGLPPAASHSYDGTGALTIRLKPRDLVDRLHMQPARTTRSYLSDAFERLARDLIVADVHVDYAPADDRRGHHLATLTASIASRRPLTTAQVHELIEEEDAHLPDVVPAFGRAAPEPVAPKPVEDAVDEPAPEVAVHVEQPVAKAASAPRVGRVRLARAAPAEPVVEVATAPVETDRERMDRLRRAAEAASTVAPTDAVVPPPLLPTHTVPVEGSPTRYGPHREDRYTRVPLTDGRLPEVNAYGTALPPAERPHPEPVYGEDGRDQHGYDREGYDREDHHWYTLLLSDEREVGVKKKGVPVVVRHVGLPPTDRDRWVKTSFSPVRPPEQTPWYCSTPVRVWLSVEHDLNWDERRFPLWAWCHGAPQDEDVWHIDDETLKTVHEYTPRAVQVASWAEIHAYVESAVQHQRNREPDLGDLPAGYVIEPGYDLAEVMSHCLR